MRGALLAALAACGGAPNPSPCEGDDALLACSVRTLSDDHYVAQAHAYFDTMDYEPVGEIEPDYADTVARWEWPPWLKLTAFGATDIRASDALLVAYPSVVKERDCRAFDTPPFARCRVVFYYDAHDGKGCPIYEEFAFNAGGQITWIEAWTDGPAFGFGEPGDEVDPGRLSTRIPGLGTTDGAIDPNSDAMAKAARKDSDVADFAERAKDWTAAWAEELAANGGDAMWEAGCGW